MSVKPPSIISSAIITLALGFSVQSSKANADISVNDCSNRISIVDRQPIASWDDNNDGFTTLDPRVTLKNRNSVAGWSTVVYEGKGCLEIKYPKGEPANRWRTIHRSYPDGLNLDGRTIVEYGIMSNEGPGRDFITRLTLTGPGAQKFESKAHIIPTLWRGVMFDVTKCPFLGDIRDIEIAISNEGSEPWTHSTYYVDGLCAGRPVDFDFNVAGSSSLFKSIGKGHVSDSNSHLHYTFNRGGALELRIDSSHNSMYNPPLKLRNTIRMTVTNNSSADSIRLYFTTDHTAPFASSQSKTVKLPAHGQSGIVQVNLSDLPNADKRLKGLRFEPLNGSGKLSIDRITFEREKPISPNAGTITSARATAKKITVTGLADRQWLDSGAVTIEVRHAPLYRAALPVDSLELLDYVPFSTEFSLSGIDNSQSDGAMTRLSSRLAAYVRLADGRYIPVGEPFFIENWSDFTANPYKFSLPDLNVLVEDFGAKGDGFTNDNGAIQKAIDYVSTQGGGTVTLSNGHEYIATNLLMRSNVELNIMPQATLRQSSRFADYTDYRPEYGHDNIIPNTPWTHCMYTNMPLILAKDVENIKIIGGGKIRMEDTYTENPAWTHYAAHCSDRLHIVPIAVCNTRHVEISDIDIIRCNNYHTIFYRADSVFIGNLKMLEVACLSGDGISLGNATTNFKIDRCVFESNDDGIVLAASYKDPRGGGWRERVDTIDASIRNIEVARSYIDSNCGGGGKAIAFIPWASTNPRLDHNEIDGIHVHDCVLRGGHSVGTWPDNPFDGKPFTNAEVDDYSPIKNVVIKDNQYLSECTMLWVVPTSFTTDCGLHGSSTLKNADFNDHTAYWTVKGNIDAETPGQVKLHRGDTVSQRLWLTPGKYNVEYAADAEIYVSPGATFTVTDECEQTVSFTATTDCVLQNVTMTKQ